MILDSLRDVRFVSAFRYHNKISAYFKITMSHFLYKISGSSRYFFGDRSFDTHAGDILLIPRGAEFSTGLLEEGDYAIIYFETPEDLPPEVVFFPGRIFPEPSATPGGAQKELHVYPGGATPDLEGLFLSAASLWPTNDTAAWCLCQAKLLELIGRLAENIQRGKLRPAEQRILQEPVAYMEKHMFESTFSLTEMYALSGVSEPYFRRIFESLYTMPPKRYALSSRITRAKYLLITDPTLRVQDAAEAVGYTDVFHFSKTFKKETGMSPETFRKEGM